MILHMTLNDLWTDQASIRAVLGQTFWDQQ